MREEFLGNYRLTTEKPESIDFGEGKHYLPKTMGDRIAFKTVNFLRTITDTYFCKDHYMRAVMMETTAAVLGMLGAIAFFLFQV